MSSSHLTNEIVPETSVIFICDLQPRFRDAITNFDRVVLTADKIIKAAKLLKIRVLASEQKPEVFGKAVPELGLEELPKDIYLGSFAKTKFSMVTDSVKDALRSASLIRTIVILGIETHICVVQTALDLLRLDYNVVVLADGVSSCNVEEIPVALDRVRHAGGIVTTSESFLYQVVQDASRPEFREFAKLIKETRADTQTTLRAILGSS